MHGFYVRFVLQKLYLNCLLFYIRRPVVRWITNIFLMHFLFFIVVTLKKYLQFAGKYDNINFVP